jgi:hypothetical protein
LDGKDSYQLKEVEASAVGAAAVVSGAETEWPILLQVKSAVVQRDSGNHLESFGFSHLSFGLSSWINRPSETVLAIV